VIDLRAISLILLASTSLSAAPWGKDADLVLQKSKEIPRSPSNFTLALPLALIQFHQQVISPADGPRSHYIPSSSQYTKEALQKYGFFYGGLFGFDRLMRENSDPWIYPPRPSSEGGTLKWDPLP
jgi:Uncharacterized conserved protein